MPEGYEEYSFPLAGVPVMALEALLKEVKPLRFQASWSKIKV